MIDWLLDYFREVAILFAGAAPYLLFGFLLAGLLKVCGQPPQNGGHTSASRAAEYGKAARLPNGIKQTGNRGLLVAGGVKRVVMAVSHRT